MAGDEAPLEPPAPQGDTEPSTTTDTTDGTSDDTETETTATEATTESDKPEVTAEDEADPGSTVTVDEEGKIRLGKNELAFIDKLKAAKADKGVIERYVDSLKREKRARMLRDDAERKAAEAIEKQQQIEAQLAETTEKSLLTPSGPLANLQTVQDLDSAEQQVLADLKQEAEDPEGYLSRFKDTDQSTAMENAARWKQRCLSLLPQFKEQRHIIETRKATQESLKKAMPALFNPATEEGKYRLKQYATDPRLAADYDEQLAHQLRGRKIAEDEKTGKFKWIRVDLEAARANGALGGKKPAAANGNGNGHGNGKVQPGKQVTLPPPRQSLPAMPAGTNRLQELRARAAKGESVSMDEMIEAQMG